MAIKSPIPSKKPNNIMRLTLFWAILVVGVLIAIAVVTPHENLKSVALSDVIKRANEGEITKIVVQGNELKITPKGSDNATEKSTKDASSSLTEQGLKLDSGVVLSVDPPSTTGDVLWNLAIIVVPVLLIAGFFMFMMRQAQ
jgi:ATP-dependent Zn protease